MHIPIIRYKKIPLFISGVLVLLSLIALFVFGLKPGIDFTGGSLMEISFSSETPDIGSVKNAIVSASSTPADLGEITVQKVDDTGLIIRMRFLSETEHALIFETLQKTFENQENKIAEDRFETIGSSISSQLRARAYVITIIVVLVIILFIAYSFRKVSKPVNSWKYGISAIIALVHDIVITMGVFAILGRFAGVEVNIPFVVALMTILGYSINDTIVVFDRIRENLSIKGKENFESLIDESINSTISRSVNTSFTTLLVLIILFFVGGESIRYFALALIVGIALGTYSSIFIASPTLVLWHREK